MYFLRFPPWFLDDLHPVDYIVEGKVFFPDPQNGFLKDINGESLSVVCVFLLKVKIFSGDSIVLDTLYLSSFGTSWVLEFFFGHQCHINISNLTPHP